MRSSAKLISPSLVSTHPPSESGSSATTMADPSAAADTKPALTGAMFLIRSVAVSSTRCAPLAPAPASRGSPSKKHPARAHRRAWLFSRRSGPFWQKLGFGPADRSALAAVLSDTQQVRLFSRTGQLELEVAWMRELEAPSWHPTVCTVGDGRLRPVERSMMECGVTHPFGVRSSTTAMQPVIAAHRVPTDRARSSAGRTDVGRVIDSYLRVRDLVDRALGADGTLRHVGSTAVPGMNRQAGHRRRLARARRARRGCLALRGSKPLGFV